MTFTLRPYQSDAQNAILAAEKRGIKRQLIVIPTGGGKTVVFATLPLFRSNSLPMLVLAHRTELLDQAKEKILQVNPKLKVEIERGSDYAHRTNADVVIASVPTLGRSDSSRLTEFAPDYFKTIIVDEAHHAAANSYANILNYFVADLTLGFTATPQRGDHIRLTDRFDEVAYYISIQELMKNGYLSPLRGYRVSSDIDISNVSTRAGDYSDSDLEAVINVEERNDLIVRAYQKLAPGLKTIAFCSTVRHARDLGNHFARQSISYEIILGDTAKDERMDTLGRFRSGGIRVLINVGVLTEGFDEPSVECIILARPTRSNLLYTQIVGRGTRLFEGKNHCLIIDIADMTKGKKPLGLPTLLGLPPDFDLAGEDLLDAAEEFSELEKKSPSEASRVRSLEDIQLAYKQIDLFAPPAPSKTVLEYSALIWSEVGENNFYLNVQRGESIHISQTPLGRYQCVFIGAQTGQALGDVDTLREAFAQVDDWIKKNRKDAMKLLDSSAIWRSEAPTDKQMKYLLKFGVPITSDMTKGMASMILDKLFKENPAKPKSTKQQWAIKNALNKRNSYHKKDYF